MCGALGQGAPSFVSASWFPPEIRGRVTAAGYAEPSPNRLNPRPPSDPHPDPRFMAPFVGQSAGYLVSMQIDESSGEVLRAAKP